MKFPAVLLVLTLALASSSALASIVAVRQNSPSLDLPDDFGCGLSTGEGAAKVDPAPFYAAWPGISSITVNVPFPACNAVAVLSETEKQLLLKRVCRPLDAWAKSETDSFVACSMIEAPLIYGTYWRPKVKVFFKSKDDSTVRFYLNLLVAMNTVEGIEPTVTNAPSTTTNSKATPAPMSTTQPPMRTSITRPETRPPSTTSSTRPERWPSSTSSNTRPARREPTTITRPTTTTTTTTTTEPPTDPPTEPPTTTRSPTTTMRPRPRPTTTSRRPATTTQATQATTLTTDDKCGGFRVKRKEVKDMTDTEWTNYLEAHRLVRVNKKWEQFANAHRLGQHGNAYFLIWHRLMLYEWDRALNEAVPGVVQPYYDWSKVSTNMLVDSVWQEDGKFQTWQIPPRPTSEGTGILAGFEDLPVARNLTAGVQHSPADIADIVNRMPRFVDFSRGIEFAHGNFHSIVGGDMMEFHRAPLDVVFYMHHAFIDKLWKDWQKAGNTEPRVSSTSLSMTRTMRPWGKTALEVLDASECTDYEESDAGSSLEATDRAIQVGGLEVSGAEDDAPTIFKSKADLIQCKKDALKKIIANPGAVKKEAEVQLRIENRMIQTAHAFGIDLLFTNNTVKILRDVVLMGNHNIDLSSADELVMSSNAEAIAKAQSDLQEIADTGNLPGGEAAEVISVKDVNLESLLTFD